MDLITVPCYQCNNEAIQLFCSSFTPVSRMKISINKGKKMDPIVHEYNLETLYGLNIQKHSLLNTGKLAATGSFWCQKGLSQEGRYVGVNILVNGFLTLFRALGEQFQQACHGTAWNERTDNPLVVLKL